MHSFDSERQVAAEELAELWVAALPVVGAYVRAEVRDRHHAEDVLQEVGQAVMSTSSRYDASRPFTKWVFGIARKQILRYYRQCSKDRAIFRSDVVEGLAAEYEALLPTLPARREALEECLKTLRPRQTQVIQMYYHDNMPLPEISGELGMSRSALGVLLHRTRLALKDCINRRLSKELG